MAQQRPNIATKITQNALAFGNLVHVRNPDVKKTP
jgi:hypothetical protein